LAGYLLLAGSMVAISLGLDGLSELGFRHGTVLVLVLLGLVALSAYWLRAARHPAPLFPLALFKLQSFAVGLIGNLFARIGSGSMPFLIPLLLQVTLGYTPLEAGLMMIPTAVAGMGIKRVATPLVLRLGYRRILIVNTALVGCVIASFAWSGPGVPVWLRLLQLGIFGALNSMQFSAMNTLTLKDLEGPLASAGNSLLSMVMMLSMSLGVAAAGGLLSTFTHAVAGEGAATPAAAFRATFATMGCITAASSWVFWQLSAQAASRHAQRGAKAETEAGVSSG
jgi:hypothetical protein